MQTGDGLFKKGEHLSAAKLNQAFGGKKTDVSGSGKLTETPDGNIIHVDLPENIYIKLTGKSGTSPIKYGWKEVARLANGTWLDTTRTANTTDDYAIELNNSNLSTSDGYIYRAERSPHTGEWLFFLRRRSTGAGTVNLLANLSYLGTGDPCTSSWFFGGANVPASAYVGWGVGTLAAGKYGTASYNWIEFQYQLPGDTSWTTIKRFYPGVDPDPRVTAYAWNAPSFPVTVKVLSSASQSVLGVLTPTGFFKPPDTYYVYTNVLTDATGTSNLTAAGSATIAGTGTVDQPSRNMSPLPSTAIISYSGVSTKITVSGLANAAKVIDNQSYTFQLDSNSKYEMLSTIKGYLKIASGTIDIIGSASGFDSAGRAVSCNLYRGASSGAPAGNCTNLSGSYKTGYAVSVSRLRYAKNPDGYGVGNYVDLVFGTVIVSDSIFFQDTSTGIAHYSTANPMVYLSPSWSPGLFTTPPTSPPTLYGTLAFYAGQLTPSNDSMNATYNYSVTFV